MRERVDNPPRLEVQAQNIPSDLMRGRKWVVWRWEERDGRWTKPPYDPDSGRHAKSDDPSTWGNFAQAWRAYEGGQYDGIGYMIQKSDNLAGFDWDKCRNPETGEIRPDVLERVKRLNTYTEVSPSGTGLKSLARGKFPGKDRQDARGGVYSGGRYFCITGHAFDGLSPKIEARKDVVEALYRELFPGEEKATASPEPKRGHGGAHGLTDAAIIEKAIAAKEGGKFRAL